MAEFLVVCLCAFMAFLVVMSMIKSLIEEPEKRATDEKLKAAREQIRAAWARGAEAPDHALRTMHRLAPNEPLSMLAPRKR